MVAHAFINLSYLLAMNMDVEKGKQTFSKCAEKAQKSLKCREHGVSAQ